MTLKEIFSRSGSKECTTTCVTNLTNVTGVAHPVPENWKTRQKQKRLERQSSPTSKPIHGVFRSFFPYQCPLFFPSATLATQTMINNALCFWGNRSTLHKMTVYLPCLIHPWYGLLNPFKSCGAMTNSWPIKFDRGRLVLIEVDVPWRG